MLLVLQKIPSDVFIEMAMEWLDVRDLMTVLSEVPLLLNELRGASFVAKRVLDDAELAWFLTVGVKVVLLSECRGIASHRQWSRNGKLHRDGDLPAYEITLEGFILREWYVEGKQHRDGDLPAMEAMVWSPTNSWWNRERVWYFHGKRHRDNNLPATVIDFCRELPTAMTSSSAGEI